MMIYITISITGFTKQVFATTKEAYEETFDALFKSLDNIERILTLTHFLVGNNITEADWRLFTTLIRFDAVYFWPLQMQ